VADDVVATDKGGKFKPHDEGQFAAVCADVVSLGAKIEQFPGKPARIMDKCALVFVTDTEGETKEIAREFSVSMNEKASLRAFLEAWRGKSYTEDQAKTGVPLAKLVGHGALISVEHRQSVKGRTYGNIKAISPLPKAMPAPLADAYTRQDFWAERKAGYAEEAKKWADAQAKVQAKSESFEDFPEALDDEDDDLPF
jgi:hypothetical protein